jgi:hypothetical protein
MNHQMPSRCRSLSEPARFVSYRQWQKNLLSKISRFHHPFIHPPIVQGDRCVAACCGCQHRASPVPEYHSVKSSSVALQQVCWISFSPRSIADYYYYYCYRFRTRHVGVSEEIQHTTIIPTHLFSIVTHTPAERY